MQNFLIFDSLPSLIKSGEFLLIDGFIDKNFSGTDSEKLFQENLKTQPTEWIYRTKPVRYTINKKGYRTVKFEKIDWKNSVVIFGCSNTFGVGLDDADTISAQLSRLINRPVINMGVGGSSILFSLYNNVILSSYYPTPKAVVNLWTSLDRTVYFYNKSIRSYGPWNFEKNNYMDLWSEDLAHGKVNSLFSSMICKQLWKGKSSYYEASFFPETTKLLDCEILKITDLARDLTHPGIESTKNAAYTIAKNLNL